MKVKIYNSEGGFISEFEAAVDDGNEKRHLFISLNDPNCNEENFRVGNLIEIGNWSGVVSTPRTWESDRVWVTLYRSMA